MSPLKRVSFNRVAALMLCVALHFLWCDNSLVAQSIAPAPAVNPLVDPLSEMTLSPSGEVNNGIRDTNSGADGILDMDIEHLSSVDAVVPAFDLEISSVNKQEGTVGKSPAAVYVITSEMIRRSGAICIPEVLRMAPGVEVARLSSSSWSVTIRGFQDRYSNKLLVLVDGRSVYSPVFSGVFWDMLDMPLEDIDRIEVVRGPGGTLWGANAVNGIINIISKNADQTQGGLVTSGGGNQAHNISTVRHGGQIGKNLKFRVWGKYVDHGPEDSPGKFDDWRAGLGGFYADWNPGGSHDDLVTVQGSFFGGEQGVKFTLLPPTPGLPYQTSITDRGTAENSILARWTHTLDDESDWSIQSYYSQTYRDDPQVNLLINTFDVEFQYRRPIGQRHHLITGVEYRQTHDFVNTSSSTLSFGEDSRSYNTISGYIQDEIEVIDDKFTLTFGSKFEGNSFTGFEYQPSIRGLWILDKRHVAWGAISRAVRTPTRFDEDATSCFLAGTAPLTFGEFQGATDIKSEDVIAYELGYRAQTTDRYSWDIALFYNNYQNLMGYKQGMPYNAGGYWVAPFALQNNGRGKACGFEWTANWEATENWRLAGSYSFLVCDYQYFSGITRIIPAMGVSVVDPRNQFRLQSYWNFAPNWEFDVFVRYVDQLTNYNTPNYLTVDARIGWKPRKNLEFSIVGQNLLSPHHIEYQTSSYYGEPVSEIDRAVFGKVTWTR